MVLHAKIDCYKVARLENISQIETKSEGYKKMKKVLVSVLAVVLLVGSTFSVNAAGLRDVFSAKYYADKYPDLKAAFGYDEEMLWQHYQDYGLKEGRNMSPILDVKEYREKYADLNAAFGDNWDAYVQHFFDYGIKENRDNGTNFDVKTYIEAYEDIAEAFGDDLVAAAEHYLNFGMEENRTKGDPEVYQAEIEAEKEAASAPSQPGTGGNVTGPDTDEKPTRVDFEEMGVAKYEIYEYDEEGRVQKVTTYIASDDSLDEVAIHEYDGDKETVKFYEADGFFAMEVIKFDGAFFSSLMMFRDGSKILYEEDGGCFFSRTTYWDAEGNIIAEDVYTSDEDHMTYDYSADGSYIVSYYEGETEVGEEYFDANGNLIKSVEINPIENGCKEYVWKDANGNITQIRIRNAKDQHIQATYYNADGSFKRMFRNTFDEAGNMIQTTYYSEDGAVLNTIYRTYNEAGNLVELKNVSADGTYVIDTYDGNGNLISSESFNADGTPVGGSSGDGGNTGNDGDTGNDGTGEDSGNGGTEGGNGGTEGGNGDTGNDDEEDTGYGEFDEEPGIGKLDYDYEEITNDEGVVIRANWSYNGIIYYYDIYEYDEEGRVSVVTTYWAGEDCVREKTTYTYEGESVKKTVDYFREDDGTLSSTSVYIDDRVMTRLSYLPSGQKWFDEFTYEESGLRSTFTTIYAVDDTILSYRKEEWVMDGENGMRYKITEYDADRNIVSEKFRGE